MALLNGFTIIWALIFVFVLAQVNSEVEKYGKSFLEDVTMSAKDKNILDEFTRRMGPKLRVPYMRDELFLIRWLRARNFNLDDAERMLEKHLKWWEDNKMDTIRDEDWSDVNQDYKIWVEMQDKERRPVIYMNLGGWDLRKAALTGKMDRLILHVALKIEEAVSKARTLGNHNQNVSQAILLLNADEFNVVNHGCFQCISFVVRVVLLYENHFPGYANKIMVVKTPTLAQMVVEAARRVFHPETNKIFRVYGTRKNQWGPVLDKYFDKSELPLDLGGSKYLNGLEVDY